MSRKARALPSPSPDARTVSTSADVRERWRVLFGTEPPRATWLIKQAVAWQEQMAASGDVAPAIARDLAIAARQVSEARQARSGVLAPAPLSADSEAAANAAPCPTSLTHGATDAAPCNISPASTHAAPRTRSRGPRTASAPLPPASSQLVPGTRLVKAHGGRTHVVEVTTTGFAYEGAAFASLSAIAKHITGTHWNGLLFFGLRRRKTYPGKAAQHG
ncbi:DUF2924 domain-containing protein [Sphingomonas aerophila]|uniref:DUF2924 domain-containing protein n=1 Tax=Sphingomonas aerophila TaxID=1344948 RepID=A0A7W9ETF1_9SPHN|nr:hypothetical protein [Sphingomonas aerophila]